MALQRGILFQTPSLQKGERREESWPARSRPRRIRLSWAVLGLSPNYQRKYLKELEREKILERIE